MQPNNTADLRSVLHPRGEVVPLRAPLMFSDLNVIVLVHWQIHPAHEVEFHQHWRTVSLVGNRTGLVCEFLSEVVATDPVSAPFITWLLSEPGAAIA